MCLCVHGESLSCLEFSLKLTKLLSKTCVWPVLPSLESPCPSEWSAQHELDLQILRRGGQGGAQPFKEASTPSPGRLRDLGSECRCHGAHLASDPGSMVQEPGDSGKALNF